QGTGDSTCPEVDVAERFLGYRSLQADICDGHAAPRPKDSRDLAVNAELVRAEIDHSIRDHDVGPPLLDRQVLNDALAKFDVLQPQLGGHIAAAVDHLRGHVDADHATGRPRPE